MSKMQVEATELHDTDVNFVSMVKNGANRLPFRVTKGENEMSLDLGKLVRRAFAKTEKPASIIAAIVKEDTPDDRVAAILKEAGLDPKTLIKTDNDGLVTFTQKGEEKTNAEVFIMKCAGDVGLVVTGLQKGFNGYDWESTDFGTIMGSGGFCSSVSTASDMLDMTIGNILASADDPANCGSLIGKAIDDFKDYVVRLTTSLPTQAFKADVALAALVKAGPVGEKHSHEAVAAAAAKVAAMASAAAAHHADPANGGDDADDTSGAGNDDDPDDTAAQAKAKSKTMKTDLPAERPDWMPLTKWDELVEMKKADAAKGKKKLPDAKPDWMEKSDWDSLVKSNTYDVTSDLSVANAGDGSTDGFGKAKSTIGTGTSNEDYDDSIDTKARASMGMKKGEAKPKTPLAKGAVKTPAANSNTGHADDVVEHAQKGDNADIVAALQTLQKSFQTETAALKKQVTEMGTRIDSVTAKVAKTEAAIMGTTHLAAGGDAPNLKKHEVSKGAPPLLDTAYTRNAA